MIKILIILLISVFATVCILPLAVKKAVYQIRKRSQNNIDGKNGNARDYVAKVLCGGTDELAKKKYIYNGIRDCRTGNRIAGGEKICSYGCLGLGTCAEVCPDNAIIIVNGIASVDKTKCSGCGKCINVCPKNIIKLIPRSSVSWVGCVYSDITNSEYCESGCAGCGKCRDICDKGAITFDDNKMFIDNSKCDGCGKCAEICERKIIWTV